MALFGKHVTTDASAFLGVSRMSNLEDVQIPTKVKLSLLWTCTILCYLYCDYFGLYVPGKINSIISGKAGPFGSITQVSLLGMGTLLLVPCLMVAASIFLRPTFSRWTNIFVGALYTGLMALIAASVDWNFYRIYATVEALLTLAIVYIAWKWPNQNQLPAA